MEIKIKRCSNPNAWYNHLVGTTVNVSSYGTMCAITEDGKMIDFYDLDFDGIDFFKFQREK